MGNNDKPVRVPAKPTTVPAKPAPPPATPEYIKTRDGSPVIKSKLSGKLSPAIPEAIMFNRRKV